MKNIDVCVILCGGTSKRLKNKDAESKIFLPFGNKSLVAYQFEKMQEIFPKVFISCKENQRESIKQSLLDSADCKKEKCNFSEIFIAEKEEAFAPIFGILSALQETKSEKIFVLSCDCPLVKPKTIDILCKNSKDYEITCAKDSTNIHYLVGVWSASLLPILRESIENNNFKLQNLSSLASIKSIFFDRAEFLNINTKSDYKDALKILGA